MGAQIWGAQTWYMYHYQFWHQSTQVFVGNCYTCRQNYLKYTSIWFTLMFKGASELCYNWFSLWHISGWWIRFIMVNILVCSLDRWFHFLIISSLPQWEGAKKPHFQVYHYFNQSMNQSLAVIILSPSSYLLKKETKDLNNINKILCNIL